MATEMLRDSGCQDAEAEGPAPISTGKIAIEPLSCQGSHAAVAHHGEHKLAALQIRLIRRCPSVPETQPPAAARANMLSRRRGSVSGALERTQGLLPQDPLAHNLPIDSTIKPFSPSSFEDYSDLFCIDSVIITPPTRMKH